MTDSGYGKPVIKSHRGHGWELFRGDTLAVLPGLPDDSVDGVIADPPYSSGGMTAARRVRPTGEKYLRKHNRTRWIFPDFGGDNQDQWSFLHWSAIWMGECLRVTKEGGVIAVFTDWRQLPVMTTALQAGGWVWRGVLGWFKSHSAGRTSNRRPSQPLEFVVWGSAGPMSAEREGAWVPGMIECGPDGSNKQHQAGKPEKLMEILVPIVERGGVVLDPFNGSGTTGVAALRHGMTYIGIEQSEEYVKISLERLKMAARQGQLFQHPLDAATP